MQDPMTVDAHEHGITRVFSVEADGGKLTSEEVALALGADGINAVKIEVVEASALDGMGLSGYLVDGYGIAANDVSADREKLDALEGQVALVPSSAFAGKTLLQPANTLRFVGAYGEVPAPAHEVMTPTETAERPVVADEPPQRPVEKRRVPVGLIVAGALLLAAILVLLF